MTYKGRDGGMVLPLSRQGMNTPLGIIIVETIAYLGKHYPDKCNRGEAVALFVKSDGRQERYLAYRGVVQRLDKSGLITGILGEKDTIESVFGNGTDLEIHIPEEQPVLTRE